MYARSLQLLCERCALPPSARRRSIGRRLCPSPLPHGPLPPCVTHRAARRRFVHVRAHLQQRCWTIDKRIPPAKSRLTGLQTADHCQPPRQQITASLQDSRSLPAFQDIRSLPASQITASSRGPIQADRDQTTLSISITTQSWGYLIRRVVTTGGGVDFDRWAINQIITCRKYYR